MKIFPRVFINKPLADILINLVNCIQDCHSVGAYWMASWLLKYWNTSLLIGKLPLPSMPFLHSFWCEPSFIILCLSSTSMRQGWNLAQQGVPRDLLQHSGSVPPGGSVSRPHWLWNVLAVISKSKQRTSWDFDTIFPTICSHLDFSQAPQN